MDVAFLKTRIFALGASGKIGLDLTPVWVRFGEPAVWIPKTGPSKDWLVYSDPRITVDDLALSATVLADPSLINANYDTPGRTESDRRNGHAQVFADASGSVVDWDHDDKSITPQDVMELQGPQVENWAWAGVNVTGELEPKDA